MLRRELRLQGRDWPIFFSFELIGLGFNKNSINLSEKGRNLCRKSALFKKAQS